MIREMFVPILMFATTCGCLIYNWVVNWSRWNEGWVSVAAYLCMVIRLSSFKR